MPRRHLVPTLLLAVALAVTGCGGDDDTPTPTQGSAAPAASDEQLNLKGSCPATVVVQTDWDPESEYGVYYHLLGPNPEVDTERKRVSAPLVAQGKDTGVRLEVRTGGPSIGFEPVSAQMYKDKSITLGQVSTDEAIRFSAGQPTQAVVAPHGGQPLHDHVGPGDLPPVPAHRRHRQDRHQGLLLRGRHYRSSAVTPLPLSHPLVKLVGVE